MNLLFAFILVRLLEIYLVAGVLFAIFFVIKGVERIDPTAKQSTLGFRLIILPGAAALWPVLAWRWFRGAEQPIEKNAHRLTACQHQCQKTNGGEK